MRRITLALALAGAVIATGCSGGASSTTGGNPGVADGTFTLTIQNGQDGNTSLAITNGYVTSSPVGIDCGVAPHNVCSFEFPTNSEVTLTAHASADQYFLGWAGDCTNVDSVCTIQGEAADQYVVARFGTDLLSGHPNWDPDADPALEHATQANLMLATIPLSGPFQCGDCHGKSLTGLAMAPSCANCHAGSVTPPVVEGAPDALATGETCANCHNGQGAAHQAKYNKYTDASDLAITINGITSVETPAGSGKYVATMTVTITKDGAPLTGIIEADGVGFTGALPQKTFYATTFNPATNDFDTTVNFNANTAVATATPGQYTVTANKKQNGSTGTNVTSDLTFQIETGPAVAFAYVTDEPLPLEAFTAYNNVAHDGMEFGTVDYVSPANDSGCQKCHGTPYRKHGYRVAVSEGIDEMVACKVCHYDTRNGGHQAWQLLAEDPAAYAAQGGATTPEQNVRLAYKASVMNDTHMSHAMEFAYPQSMGNCVACHEGKLDITVTDANFTITTCKSCHPVTATHPDAHRAPPLTPAGVAGSVLPAYHSATMAACNSCHADAVCGYDTVTHTGVPCADGAPAATDGAGPTFCFDPPTCANTEYVPLFKEIHSGLNAQIFKADGSKYSASITSSITASTWNSSTNVLTVDFTVAGAAADAIIKPTVVASLYGYDTKDFIVGGHGNAADGKRNLEWAEGASSNSPRLTVTPNATPGNAAWTATFDLSAWATMIANGEVKKIEIGFLPSIGLDQTVAASATNPYLAVSGLSRTFDLVGGVFLADGEVYGKDIVDAGKCNKCHEALATTFHNANYGSAGVVGCRLCHIVGSGGSHLPMQSRSIDSYVHSIHSMQPFDPGDIDFSDPVEALHYEHHIESTYPNFTTLNCESCHNPGMYNIPDQTKSLPGILSANDPGMPFTVAATATGPGSRACGGCHRAALINAGDTAGLGTFDTHTKAFGYRETAASSSALTTRLYEIIDALFCDDGETCTAPPPPP